MLYLTKGSLQRDRLHSAAQTYNKDNKKQMLNVRNMTQ